MESGFGTNEAEWTGNVETPPSFSVQRLPTKGPRLALADWELRSCVKVEVAVLGLGFIRVYVNVGFIRVYMNVGFI